MSIRLAYHESGHALATRFFSRRVDSVSLAPVGGGQVRHEPIAPEGTDEEIEQLLVIVLAGREAERYAPSVLAEGNGRDPWFSAGEMAAMAAVEDAKAAAEETGHAPSDEEVIEHFTKRIGSEAVASAREFAEEIVARMHAVGRLEQLADEILFRGHLTGDDVERLLA